MLNEAKGAGSFDANVIMKIYSDDCHNCGVNDDDLDGDDDKRLEWLKTLCPPAEFIPYYSWSAELHLSSWVWKVQWFCVIASCLPSPATTNEKMLSDRQDVANSVLQSNNDAG